MKTIFITLTSGFAARNVLQTDVFKVLASAGLRLVFFVPPGTVQDFKHLEVEGKVVFHEYSRPGYFERKLGNFRCLNNFEQAATWKLNTDTIKAKRRIQKNKRKLRYYIYRFFALLVSSEFIFKLLRELEWFLFPKNWIVDYFILYRPDMVYSTDPMFFDELYFLEYAKKHKIKIISQILSWDNLTGRGVLPVIPDWVIVWNQIMQQQMVEIYKYPKNKVYISGIPQFDFYFDARNFPNREEFCVSAGLDPKKKIIVYTTGSPSNYPSEPIFLEGIAKSIFEDSRIRDNCQLYVRVNPRDNLSSYASLPKYKDVVVSLAGSENKRFRDGWNPDVKSMKSLAASLKHADVVLSMSSTIILEAVIFDTPFVVIDIDKRLSYFYEFNHFKRIVSKTGVPIARSADEVVKYINSFFIDKNLGSDVRKAIEKEECEFLDGKSAMRIGNFLINHL